MYHPKVVTPVTVTAGTVASLPVTGSPVVLIVATGVGLVIGGFLMVRASRFRQIA